jgi:hypothetical protein
MDADVSELIRWHREQAINRVNAKKKEAHYNRANLIERLAREKAELQAKVEELRVRLGLWPH